MTYSKQTSSAMRALAIALTPALALGAASTASAQETRDRASVGEIVVMARRVEENIQKVPIAISAMRAEDIKALQISSFMDAKNVVPSLNVQEQFGQPSTPQVFLRGVPTGLLNFTVDAGVGMYVDGVYIGRSVGSAFSQPDLERIEVLKGPQGTLFGRNSTGGAVNFISPAPTGKFGGTLEATAGNFNQERYRATINTPEVAGLSARLTYVHNEHDGYVKNSGPKITWALPEPFGNITTADSYGLVDEDAVYAAVRYTGIDKLTLDYKFDWSESTQSQLAVQFLGSETGDFGDGMRLGSNANGGVAPSSTDRQDSLPLGFSTPGKTRALGHSLTANFDVTDAVSVKSISAYREMKQFSGGNDIDGGNWVDPFTASGTPFCQICSIAIRDHDQFSQELQLIGAYDRANWIVGAYSFKENGDVNNPTFATRYFPGFSSGPIGNAGAALSAFGLPDYFLGENISMENSALAAYAHADYKLSDSLTIAGGLRYTEDKREVDDRFLSASFDEKFSHTDYDASLSYQASEGVSFYGRVATGYVTGGILRGTVFKPETVDSYELGMKTKLLDNRLRINSAIFRMERDKLQTTFFGPTGLSLLNQGSATTDGLEIETTYVPIDGLTLNASLSLLSTDYSVTQNSPYPEMQVILSGQYDFAPMANGSYISVRADANYTDKYSGFTLPLANTALEDALMQGDQWDVGLRASLSEIPLGSTKGRLSLWGKNMLDNDKPEFVRNLFGYAGGSFQVPRTYGVDLAVSF